MGGFREILVAVAGLTPQVITETLYYLTQVRDPPVAIVAIHVLTTEPGGQRILADLLTPDEGRFYAFCREYGLDPTSIAFDAHHIHVSTDAAGIPLEDIRTAADSAAVADQILALIGRLTDDPNTRLHCSLAGGRKTLSALLGFALQLYGRPQDTLLHVLVDEAFENHPDFSIRPDSREPSRLGMDASAMRAPYVSMWQRFRMYDCGRNFSVISPRLQLALTKSSRTRSRLWTSFPIQRC